MAIRRAAMYYLLDYAMGTFGSDFQSPTAELDLMRRLFILPLCYFQGRFRDNNLPGVRPPLKPLYPFSGDRAIPVN